MKKVVYFLTAALLVSLVCNYAQCTGSDVKTDTVTVERTDTQYITKTDTLPEVSKEIVIDYVEIPITVDSIAHDTFRLDVVQRTYTDDSTYTAYISGIKYADLPKLDSIAVRQRNIYHDIERTITVKSQRRLSIGLQTGAGVGIICRQPDIYIGIGVQWRLY
jgi:hypothetical protein